MEQEPKTPRKRAEDLLSLLVSDWRPNPRQVLWSIRIGVALGLIVAIGYSYDVTLWDWIKLLIVPAVIAAGGLWFNAQQSEREQQTANERAQDEALQAYLDHMSQLLTDKEHPLRKASPDDDSSAVARARTLTVLLRLDGSRKRSVLQFMYESDLIAKEHPVVYLALADLSEANLSGVMRGLSVRDADLREVDLSNAHMHSADLSGADLSGANLSNADLSEAILFETRINAANLIGANLSGANLYEADLSGANLSNADLSGANLSNADLSGAALSGANLSGANLYEANLSEADLSEADLSETNLYEADLSGANLSNANLSGAYANGPFTAARARERAQRAASMRKAGLSLADIRRTFDKELIVPSEEIEVQTKLLKGATMPNGQEYEEWLKSKGRKEDGKNFGPS